MSQPHVATILGLQPDQATSTTIIANGSQPLVFTTPEAQHVARIAYQVIRKYENKPDVLPTLEHLKRPEIQAEIVKAVEEQNTIGQLQLTEVLEPLDIPAIVAQTVELVTQQTISIPRVLVVPRGEVRSGFKPFTLDLSRLDFLPISDELWIQDLRTGKLEIVRSSGGGADEKRLEDYIVSGLLDFNDVSYEDHADLLYDLATQTVDHFQSYLSPDETRDVLRHYQRNIARFIYVQMQEHYWEEAAEYDVKISKGFTDLKPSAYTHSVHESRLHYRVSPADKSNMSKYLFDGFSKCLYTVQKFASDPERRLAVILERDSIKWFKPAKGQFQIWYRDGLDHSEYQPDFVAETEHMVYMLEPKASNKMSAPDVVAKREAAVKWCANASAHATSYGGKPWRYALIPHDAIQENMTLDVLAKAYGVRG